MWFRESCREVAERLGVAGEARNLDDGTVEVVAEGSPAAVDAIVAWCREGPPAARVVGVDVADEPPRGAAGFRVR